MKTVDVTRLDQFEIVAHCCKPLFQILGDEATGEYAVIDTVDVPTTALDILADPTLGPMLKRGMRWLGCTGFDRHNGTPQTALVAELDPATISVLAGAVVSALAAKVRAGFDTSSDPEILWLRDLCALPDTRPTN